MRSQSEPQRPRCLITARASSRPSCSIQSVAPPMRALRAPNSSGFRPTAAAKRRMTPFTYDVSTAAPAESVKNGACADALPAATARVKTARNAS